MGGGFHKQLPIKQSDHQTSNTPNKEKLRHNNALRKYKVQ